MTKRWRALYARVSTTEQDVETQLAPLRRYAAEHGWDAVEYIDSGVSGAKDSRPALDRMMADIRAGRVVAVAVWKFDRFARSTQHLLRALEEFRSRDVGFVSVTEAIDTSTAMGRMVFTFLGAIAEFERSLIVERTHAGLARARAEGKLCHAPRKPYDLRTADALLAEGVSVREVSRRTNVPRTTLRRRLAEREHGGKGRDLEG